MYLLFKYYNMGQYYTPTILTKRGAIKKFWYSHKYDNGLKLMEHSYINNELCNAVENYLFHNPQILVWAGDYADNEFGRDYNIYIKCYTGSNKKKEDDCGNSNNLPNKYYVVNHTKHLYYSRDEVGISFTLDNHNYKINPLPLLTCEGNGRGGGDYDGNWMSLIGSWARDVIEVTDIEPIGYTKEQYGFKE